MVKKQGLTVEHRNYIQYRMINHMEKYKKKVYICVSVCVELNYFAVQ